MKRSKLRPRSKKRESEWKVYLKKRADFLESHAGCETWFGSVEGCEVRSRDVHHKKGRSGKLLNNMRYWLAVCRPCHDWIETHKREARKLGYILYT